jgi:large-conductance mechanosensitive channel
MDILGNTIVTTTQTAKKFNDNFKSFTTNQTFIIMAAAICIGMATKDAIDKLLNEVLYPIIKKIASFSIGVILYRKALEKTTSMSTIHSILESIGSVVWIFFVWLIIIFLSYLLLKKLLSIDFVKPQLDFVEDNSKRFLLGNEGGVVAQEKREGFYLL